MKKTFIIFIALLTLSCSKMELAEEQKHYSFEAVANDVHFEMIYVEGGTFTMGATEEQYEDAYTTEVPTHEVTLTDYYIGKYEVTQKLWNAVMGSNPSYHTEDENNPVDKVSWDNCREFISRLNAMTGLEYSLPTEAQWEYAARGGKKSKGYKYSGSNDLTEVGWWTENSDDKSHPVGSLKANELGIHDMSGNVLEWCQDWYGNYTEDAVTDPEGPSSGIDGIRIFRGGSYAYDASGNRSSYRDGDTPDKIYINVGMRLALKVKNLPPAEPEEPTPPATGSSFTYDGMDNGGVFCTANGVPFSLMYVEGGTFSMGATTTQDSEARPDESPVHSVTLPSYYMGQCEVTQELWEAVMGYNPSTHEIGDDRPVNNVCWEDCNGFVYMLSEMSGLEFSLPTEAQWEYAARGGNRSQGFKYSGSNTIDYVAWYNGNSDSRYHGVMEKEPNELGLHDMSGNVFEWCNDWYGSYGSAAQHNPQGPDSGNNKVLRGGSFNNPAEVCRVYDRRYAEPGNRNDVYGLRIVLNTLLWQNDSEQGIDYTAAKDLSAAGTANCYIVSSAASYKFPTVKGNASTSVGSVASAEVLWESFGTSESITRGRLVTKAEYLDGYIYFTTPGEYREGNALIAAKDASGKILWSWHIWLTDKPEDQVYNNNAGIMMDRNLGATSAFPGDVGALGLLYQWGRKDPFLGSSSISESVVAKSTVTWPSAVTSNSINGTIGYAVQHPTTFIKMNTTNYDWYYTGNNGSDATRWQSTKTIYDPCPPGYRVPDGGSDGVWEKAFGDAVATPGYETRYEGFNFGSSSAGKKLTDNASVCWYPTTGLLGYGDGLLTGTGNNGRCWSCVPGNNNTFFLFNESGVGGLAYNYNAYGWSVRCRKM